MNYHYRSIQHEEIDSAIELALSVFMEFEAPEYSEEGVEAFKSFLFSEDFKRYYTEEHNFFAGCFDGETLVGIAAMRNESHICLVFVDKSYHRKGIASRLLEMMIENRKQAGIERITLNSSPYGAPFYRAIGFVDTDVEQTQDGIRFIPMIYYIK